MVGYQKINENMGMSKTFHNKVQLPHNLVECNFMYTRPFSISLSPSYKSFDMHIFVQRYALARMYIICTMYFVLQTDMDMFEPC